jgi:hypothetical protein
MRYSCLGRSLPQVFDGTALDRKATERNRCKAMSLTRSPRDDLVRMVWRENTWNATAAPQYGRR